MSAESVLNLMLPSFCLCVLMVGMLSYLGLHVIRREIIFVDLALAQIAALGALIGFLLGIPLHTGASHVFAIALTAIAAVVWLCGPPCNPGNTALSIDAAWSSSVRIMAPRGPRSVLCVVVVTTGAWPVGEGWAPPATRRTT